MMGVDGADAAHRMRHRNLQFFRERTQVVGGAAYFTPWPTRMTGRSAESSMSTVFFTPSGSAPQRDEMLALHSSGFGVSSAAAS